SNWNHVLPSSLNYRAGELATGAASNDGERFSASSPKFLGSNSDSTTTQNEPAQGRVLSSNAAVTKLICRVVNVARVNGIECWRSNVKAKRGEMRCPINIAVGDFPVSIHDALTRFKQLDLRFGERKLTRKQCQFHVRIDGIDGTPSNC